MFDLPDPPSSTTPPGKIDAKGMFDALGIMREFTETIATSARNYGEWLESQGWSETLAEHMAYQYYSLAIMTAMQGMGESK